VFGRTFVVFGCDIHVTVSIGAVTWPTAAEVTDPDMLLFFADQALLRAKESGRDRVVSTHKLDMAVRRRFRRHYAQQGKDGTATGERRSADWSVVGRDERHAS